MIRIWKAALLLGSIGLIIGVTAGSAQATPTFQAGSYPAAVSGEAGEIVIGTGGSTVRCPIDYDATLNGASSELAFTTFIYYFSCNSWGFINTSVHNSCQQVVHVTKKEAADQYKGTLEIKCTFSSGLGITAGQCAINIPPQKVSSVDIDNATGSPNRVNLDFEVAGLAYTVTKDNFGCPLNGLGEKTGGTITGEAFQLKAVNPAKTSEELGLSVIGE
jgi:hypothetical protein